MKQIQLAKILLLALAACGCEKNERAAERERDDLGRTGETPPKAEVQPTPAPNATSTTAQPGQQTVGARDEVALAKGDREAEVDFKAAKGQKISGNAELKEMANGVQLILAVKEAPAGMK